jgi:hypothetical protein
MLKAMQFGIDTLAVAFAREPNEIKKESDSDRLLDVIQEIERADRLGLDIFRTGGIIGKISWIQHRR